MTSHSRNILKYQKGIVVFIAVCFVLCSKAQNINALANWDNTLESSLNSRARLESIESLPYYNEVIAPYYNEIVMAHSRQIVDSLCANFHEIDLNNDEGLYLIYNGNTGGEGDYLLIWEKTDAKYRRVLNISGIVSSLWESKSSQTGFNVINCGCCGDENCVFEIYEPTLKDGKLSYSVSLKYNLLGYTEVPDSLSESTRFKTINNNYTLRGSPEINDTFPPAVPSRPPGNIVCKIKKGTQGVKLAEKTDDTGRVWWFVAMEIDGMKDSYFHNGDNEGESTHALGWLSSRYVEVINNP